MKLKPGTIMPTPEEDAAITAAALLDPDAQPLTDAELAQFRPSTGPLIPTADDQIDLSLGLSPAARKAIAARALAHGITLDQAFEDVLDEGMALLERKRAIQRPPRSRNAREGKFVGFSCGKAVRWRKALRRRVRSAKARMVMVRRRAYKLRVMLPVAS